MEHRSPTQRPYDGGNGQAEYRNYEEQTYSEYGGERGYPGYEGERGYPGYGGESGHGGYEAERGPTQYAGQTYGGDQTYGGGEQTYGDHPHGYSPQFTDPSQYSSYKAQGYEDSQVAGNNAGTSGIFHNKESSYAALHDSDSERRRNRGCLDRVCCCRAKWAQWCGLLCCLIFLALIAFGIVLAVTFKKPTVEFTGVGDYPDKGVQKYVAKNGAFDINVGLNIKIDNPNIIGASFPRIKATARYPNPPDKNQTKIGGGELEDVDIPSKSITNITFPFSINYDTKADPSLVVARDILTKCRNKQKIKIDYKLVVTVRVIVINVNLNFDRSADIDCPINENNMPDIPGLNIPGFSPQKRGPSESLH